MKTAMEQKVMVGDKVTDLDFFMLQDDGHFPLYTVEEVRGGEMEIKTTYPGQNPGFAWVDRRDFVVVE